MFTEWQGSARRGWEEKEYRHDGMGWDGMTTRYDIVD